eukprot:TRINITY_DN93878_c0_g1_i1.p1 TRINITY_DN93878_c0_g1~~TRINITY_DN93878_c0_g1_i1.p1  ORF type:complete len:144 (+),score=11.42 TRINITY_DN93878_c0_g1_i1:125-556(+)
MMFWAVCLTSFLRQANGDGILARTTTSTTTLMPCTVQCVEYNGVSILAPVNTSGCAYNNEPEWTAMNAGVGTECTKTGDGCHWPDIAGCGCWLCTKDNVFMMRVIDEAGRNLKDGSTRTADGTIAYLNSHAGIDGKPFAVGQH